MVNFSFSGIWIVFHCYNHFALQTFELQWYHLDVSLKFMQGDFLTGYICYDDGCHLSKYATNPCRRDLTPITQAISQMSIVIDKMHMAGHVDAWCKENCDPRKFRDLDEVYVPN